MTATALIIDDEPDIRELIAMTLSRMGLDFHSAANLEEARQLLATYEFDVCLTDMRLPDGNGVEFVRYIQSINPSMPVAVITAHGNMEAAVEAMKNGAYDFVSKPLDIGQLRQLLVQAISLNSECASNDAHHDLTDNHQQSLISANADASNDLHALSKRTVQNDDNAQSPSLTESSLIGSSAPMQALRKMIHKVARTNAPIWITGESGTGKELIAKLIHENSPRADKPLVAINCGAIPSELMESELFGHVKGSFTGANADKPGLFNLADGGTLFFDEVAELPLHMQVKLLRAIQERSIRPVGGNTEQAIDVRILSASHADLSAEVDAGRFRHDLYYRLNVISMHAPSLRERATDIPELCKNIMHKLAERTNNAQHIIISEDAFDALAQYHFPGNVRELENILERASALIDKDTITAIDLNLPETNNNVSSTNQGNHNNQTNNAACNETNRIMEALNNTRWNRKEAATQLGLTYRQLRYRIKQLGIDNKN